METEDKMDTILKEEESYTSQIKHQNYNLKWTVMNFKSACKSATAVKSPNFPDGNSEQGQWCIILQPVELKEVSTEKFRVILKSTAKTPRFINVRISILNSTKKGALFYSHFRKIVNNFCWCKSASELYKDLSNNNSLSRKMTIICELRVFDPVNNEIEKLVSTCQKYEIILDQMERFFYDDDLKDVKFTVEEQEFRAHKAILALRSPVFSAMFKSKMSEELTSCIKIEDIRPPIFEKMLRFMYSDEVEELKNIAFDMFYAAEKYQLQKLRSLCIKSLYESISLETITQTLKLADLFSITMLKNRSLKFVLSHWEKVKNSKKFVKLIQERPHLMIEVVDLRVKNKNQEM